MSSAPLLALCVAVVACSAQARAGGAPAGGEARAAIDVPAQDLGRALFLLGQQAHVTLLFEPALVRGLRSHAVSGALPPAAALAQMLAGTSLQYRRTAGGALVVVRGPRARAPRGTTRPVDGAAPEAAELPVIIVTAQKKSELLQSTPISLVALGAADIAALRIGDVRDIGASVPNVEQRSHPSGQSSPLITIRGIGASDNQITQDPSVAVYVDGVYVARTQGMATQAPDLERIEVLRGPQGTLYGRNATGGAINLVTRAPQPGQWSLDAHALLGNLEARGAGATLNVPLGDGFAGRVVYSAERRDGPVRNLGTGAPTFGALDRTALRAGWRWVPDRAWSLRYSFDRSTARDTAFYIQFAPGGAPTKRPRASEPQVRGLQPNDFLSRGHLLAVDWRAGDAVTVKSISAWRELDSYSYQDYLSGRLGGAAPLVGVSRIRQEQWSQELQVLGAALDGRIGYVAGAYGFGERADGLSEATMASQGLVLRTRSDIDNQAWALYAQGTYTPAVLDERLHLTVAARWSRDDRAAAIATSDEHIDTGETLPGIGGHAFRAYDDLSPALTVAFDATPDIHLYAKASKGYKTGGYNLRSGTIEAFRRGFDPEQVRSYEIGLKSELFDRRLRLNAALFRANYDDIQFTIVDVNRPTNSDTINAGRAVIQGIELDLTAQPTAQLTLGLSYGGLDPRYKRIIDAAGQDVTSAYRFSVPKGSLGAQATWRLPPTPLGTPTASLRYGWQSHYLNANKAGGDYGIPSRGLIDARLELDRIPFGDGRARFRVALWAKNLADADYWFINGSLFGGYRAWGEPRTFGVEVGVAL